MSALLNSALTVLTIGALVLATGAVLRLFPSFADRVLGNEGKERTPSLDGLRGLLALCVFTHHGIITQSTSQGLPWQAPDGNFENLLGQASVALFFMISAYLFWGRVIKKNTAPISWLSFLQGRVYRLAPMYFVAILLLLAIVAVETNFTLHVPAQKLMKEIMRWCSFNFFGMPDINGLPATHTILSTIWTLRYEWIFYIGLPVMAFLYFRTGYAWLIYAGIIGYAALRGWSPVIFFAGGCIAADAFQNRKDIFRNSRLWMLFGACSLLTLIICFHDTHGLLQAALLMPVFLACLLTTGSHSFLMARPLRFLGHISYSVYLLHSPLLHIFAKGIIGNAAFGTLSPALFNLTLFVMGLCIIAVSTVTFLWIEKPLMLRGRHTIRETNNLAYAGTENAIQPAHARSQS